MIKKGMILAFLAGIFLINLILAENLEIQMKNNYLPGENLKFNSILYDDSGNIIDGEISFTIFNHYGETFKEGYIKTGEEVNFRLPENAIKGYWEVLVESNGIEKKELFSVGELEKADIRLDGDKVILVNVGNVPYKKFVQISIGENQENIMVPLDIGEKKEIKLTAPNGNYDIKVDDGSQNEDFVFSGVSLTGNVVSLENDNNSFWDKYPLVILFLASLIMAFFIVSTLKIHHKIINRPKKLKKKKKKQ